MSCSFDRSKFIDNVIDSLLPSGASLTSMTFGAYIDVTNELVQKAGGRHPAVQVFTAVRSGESVVVTIATEGVTPGTVVGFMAGAAVGAVLGSFAVGFTLSLAGGAIGSVIAGALADALFKPSSWGGGSCSPFDMDFPNPADWLFDPLVVDLNGDGVKLTALRDSTANFDFGGDGFRERTGWVSPQDGLLVRDLNGNGLIESVQELFGTQTQDAYTVLRGLDGNGDNKITAADQVWSTLRPPPGFAIWASVSDDLDARLQEQVRAEVFSVLPGSIDGGIVRIDSLRTRLLRAA